MRRRLVVLATVAVTLLTGCSGGRLAPAAARGANPARSDPAPSDPAPSDPAPSDPAPSVSAGVIVEGGQLPPSAPYPIPAFPPAPVPVPITLPAGGAVPFLLRIPTTQRVAFLTIDDGFVKTPEAPKLIAAAHIPVTLFLTINAVRDNPEYFRPMQQNGAVVEAHTITHTDLRGKSYAFQRNEICGSADRLGQWYGRRPVLFRPPFGDKDGTTLRAAHDCGIRAVFMWKETVDKGIVRYQQGRGIRPGDIILMHFRPAFLADFLAALQAIHRAGLTPALLEDYLPPGPGGTIHRGGSLPSWRAHTITNAG
jgi:peptidoglycan/xylan/chitin deacetylase (PgdA/CDA1 family)